MNFDFEKRRLERAQRKQHAQSEISALCAELEMLLLSPPDGNTDILAKQATTLDAMLRAVMQRNINADKQSGKMDNDALSLALRIQKQCMDTLKTHAAIDYMQQMALKTLKEVPSETCQSHFSRDEAQATIGRYATDQAQQHSHEENDTGRPPSPIIEEQNE